MISRTVEEGHSQRVGLASDGERRGDGRVEEDHPIGASLSGRRRIGAGILVVRRLLMVERVAEVQRPRRNTVYTEHELDIELHRGQRRISDREISMRKSPKREIWDGPGQRKRRR